MNLGLIKYIDRRVGIFFCKVVPIFFSVNKFKSKNPKKVLLIKFSGFGNIVLALPAIRAIRKKYPKSNIYFLTHSINKSIIEKDPAINKIITMDVDGTIKTLLNIFKLFINIRKENFDAVIDFEQFSRFSALITFFSGAKTRVGFDTIGQGRDNLYNLKVRYNNLQHTSKTFADIALSLEAQINFLDRKIFITNTDRKNIDLLLKNNKILKNDLLVGIHPGCGSNNPKRKWPKENFAKLADFLIKDYNAKVFFTGSNAEVNLVKEVQALMRENSFNFAGKINLRELSELISRCKLFISSDTGPLHLASAMNVPVISFFGPNTPVLYGPLGKKNLIFYKNFSCSPCTTNFNEKTSKCKHFKCITNIKFEEVKNKIKNSKILN
jgi:lipopolysaccharide heptosyltransferase II